MIKAAIGLDPIMVAGARGEFSVWVGEKRVAMKDANGFPDYTHICVGMAVDS